MPSSLAQRLATTPHLIAECDGRTVVEPLIFIPMPAGSQPQASAGRKVDSRSPGDDVSNLNHGCRNAAQ